MEEFLVISWWTDPKRIDIVPEITEHLEPKTAEKEAERRKKLLGKDSKVIITRLIKEI